MRLSRHHGIGAWSRAAIVMSILGALALACGPKDEAEEPTAVPSVRSAAQEVAENLAEVIEVAPEAVGDEQVVVWGPEGAVEAGAVLRDPFGELLAEVPARSWLLWVDPDPDARFEHTSYAVLVDAETGARTRFETKWWPVLEGAEGPWSASVSPRRREGALFEQLSGASVEAIEPEEKPELGTEEGALSNEEKRELGTEEGALSSEEECEPRRYAILIAGLTHSDKDTKNAQADLRVMKNMVTAPGVGVAPGDVHVFEGYAPESDKGLRWEDIEKKILSLGLRCCDELIIYYTGHMTTAGMANLSEKADDALGEAQIKPFLNKLDRAGGPGKVMFMWDACYSAKMSQKIQSNQEFRRDMLMGKDRMHVTSVHSAGEKETSKAGGYKGYFDGDGGWFTQLRLSETRDRAKAATERWGWSRLEAEVMMHSGVKLRKLWRHQTTGHTRHVPSKDNCPKCGDGEVQKDRKEECEKQEDCKDKPGTTCKECKCVLEQSDECQTNADCKQPANPCDETFCRQKPEGLRCVVEHRNAGSDCELTDDMCRAGECDGAGNCVPGETELVCSQSPNPCHGPGTCDPFQGCVYKKHPEVECAGDGDCPNPDDKCNASCKCEAPLTACEKPADCAHLDGPCSVGDCVRPIPEESGFCVRHIHTGADCTPAEGKCRAGQCDESGTCVAGAELVCSEGPNPCYGPGTCDPAKGCVYQKHPDVECAADPDCSAIDGAVCDTSCKCRLAFDPCTIDDDCFSLDGKWCQKFGCTVATASGRYCGYSPTDEGKPCKEGEKCVKKGICKSGKCEVEPVTEAICGDGCVIAPEECEKDGDCPPLEEEDNVRCGGCRCKGESASCGDGTRDRWEQCDDNEPVSSCPAGMTCQQCTCAGSAVPRDSCDSPGATVAAKEGVVTGNLKDFTSSGSAADAYCSGDNLSADLYSGGPDVNVEAWGGNWFSSSATVAGATPTVYIGSGCGAASPTCVDMNWDGTMGARESFEPPTARPWPKQLSAWAGGYWHYSEPLKVNLSIDPTAASKPAPLPPVPAAPPMPFNAQHLDFVLRWRALDEAPANDTRDGATVLTAGELVELQTNVFATDSFSGDGCPGLMPAEGRGSPDLFYSFTPEQSGAHIFSLLLVTTPIDARAYHFTALLAPDGTCMAASKEGDASIVADLEEGETYTLVVDMGIMDDGSLFAVWADVQRGPANADCGRAELIPATLPQVVEGGTARSTDAMFQQGDNCSLAVGSNKTGEGQPDVAYAFTPDQDQAVAITLDSKTEDFHPTLSLTLECEPASKQAACFDGFAVGDDGTGSATLELEGGKTYYLWVDGGGSAVPAGDFELRLAEGSSDAPDTCAEARKLETLPATVTLSGRNLEDRFAAQPGTCTPASEVQGEGVADAVFSYTAAEAGLLTASTEDTSIAGVYAFTGSCAEGSQASCDGIMSSARALSLRLDTGQTAYVVVDGWEPAYRSAEVELSFAWSPLAQNSTCSTATPVESLPFETSSNLASAGNDATLSDSVELRCGSLAGDPTSGEDLFFRVEPGGGASALGAALFGADFAWSLYALPGCPDMPSESCLAGLSRPEEGNAASQILVQLGADPVTVVVDHQASASGGTFRLQIQDASPPANETCDTALQVELDNTYLGNVLQASSDYVFPQGVCDEYGDGDEVAGPDVVYRLDVTQAMVDAGSTAIFTVNQATAPVDVALLKGGCEDLAARCIAKEAFSDPDFDITLSDWDLSAGDVLYLVVGGHTGADRPMFKLEVKGSWD